jgi:hypothetical protein
MGHIYGQLIERLSIGDRYQRLVDFVRFLVNYMNFFVAQEFCRLHLSFE